jgi:hypothetical protein
MHRLRALRVWRPRLRLVKRKVTTKVAQFDPVVVAPRLLAHEHLCEMFRVAEIMFRFLTR